MKFGNILSIMAQWSGTKMPSQQIREVNGMLADRAIRGKFDMFFSDVFLTNEELSSLDIDLSDEEFICAPNLYRAILNNKEWLTEQGISVKPFAIHPKTGEYVVIRLEFA